MYAMARMEAALDVIAQKLDLVVEMRLQRMFDVQSFNGWRLPWRYFYRQCQPAALGLKATLTVRVIQSDLYVVEARWAAGQQPNLAFIFHNDSFLPLVRRKPVANWHPILLAVNVITTVEHLEMDHIVLPHRGQTLPV